MEDEVAADRVVFVLEDDPGITAVVCRTCMMLDLPVRLFSMVADFRAAGEIPENGLLLLDLGLADSNGIDVLRLLAAGHCTIPIVLMSGEDERLLNTVQKLGESYGLNIAGILQKPFTLADLKQVLQDPLPLETRATKPRRASLSEQLHRGIMRGELRVHYQPKVVISPGLVVGCEALVRWQHPERGLLLPGDFLPAAEEHGLMGQLTDWVLNEALRQAAAWRDAGFDLDIAVNVPADRLQELGLPATIERLLALHRVEASRLTLEVTEAAAMRGLTRAVDVLARLRLMKVSLSIDDFGTGHSSIVKLRQLPFNELKIDRSFVQDMRTEVEARALVETMIAMGQNLGMATVAEGIESAADLDLLPTLGCELGQGYYLARPMPPEDFMVWLKERHLPWQSERLFARGSAQTA